MPIFSPAAELLRAAPWAFTRGNHEDCGRAWSGWFYYLDPRPWDGKCEEYSPPYIVKLGKFQLAMLDSSATNDSNLIEAQVDVFAAQLASLHAKERLADDSLSLLGILHGPRQRVAEPTVNTLEEAWEKAAPKGYSLILSGHVHLFEYVSVDHGCRHNWLPGTAAAHWTYQLKFR